MNNIVIIIFICLILYFSMKRTEGFENVNLGDMSFSQSVTGIDFNNITNDYFKKIKDSLNVLSDASNKIQKGNFNVPKLNMQGPINIDMNIAHPDDPRYDGQIYRADGQMQIAVDDLLRIRDRNNKETGVEIDVRPGVTPQGPNKSLRLSRKGIQFGDTNDGRQVDSAQISAGTHDADALCIVGMSNKDKSNRRIHMWAEGGTYHEGSITIPRNRKIYFNNNGNYWLGHNDNHDGPRLYHPQGGTLNTPAGGTILNWNRDGNVGVKSKLTIKGRDVVAELDDLKRRIIKYGDNFNLSARKPDPGFIHPLKVDGGGDHAFQWVGGRWPDVYFTRW